MYALYKNPQKKFPRTKPAEKQYSRDQKPPKIQYPIASNSLKQNARKVQQQITQETFLKQLG